MQELHNVMEDFVEEKLNSVLRQMEQYCQCEQCRRDMEAYALNRLPAKYVVSEKGIVFQKFDSLSVQSDAEITTAVTKAVEMIGRHPNHPVSEE